MVPVQQFATLFHHVTKRSRFKNRNSPFTEMSARIRRVTSGPWLQKNTTSVRSWLQTSQFCITRMVSLNPLTISKKACHCRNRSVHCTLLRTLPADFMCMNHSLLTRYAKRYIMVTLVPAVAGIFVENIS